MIRKNTVRMQHQEAHKAAQMEATARLVKGPEQIGTSFNGRPSTGQGPWTTTVLQQEKEELGEKKSMLRKRIRGLKGGSRGRWVGR